MPARSCGSVIAGVHFFSPSRFCDQEPRRDQGECLMVMPAAPVADLVVGEARFALGALQAFFEAVFGLGGAGELGRRCLGERVREVVVGLRHGGLVAVVWSRSRSRTTTSISSSGDSWRLSLRVRTRRFKTSTISGPFEPSRTSIRVHALAG